MTGIFSIGIYSWNDCGYHHILTPQCIHIGWVGHCRVAENQNGHFHAKQTFHPKFQNHSTTSNLVSYIYIYKAKGVNFTILKSEPQFFEKASLGMPSQWIRFYYKKSLWVINN